jgi:hypothetical protein
MYSNIDSHHKVEIDAVEYRKRLQCLTQVLKAFIRNLLATRKKREIE